MTHSTPPTTPHVVRSDVEIAAPPERVFEALTDPRVLAAWWGDADGSRVLDCASDPRPGGAWRVRTREPNGAEREAAGEYRVVDAPRRLEQSWRATGDEGESVVRYDLAPLEVGGQDGTRLTVTHTSPVAAAALTARFQPAWCAARVAHRFAHRFAHRVAWARRATLTRTA